MVYFGPLSTCGLPCNRSRTLFLISKIINPKIKLMMKKEKLTAKSNRVIFVEDMAIDESKS